MSISSQLCKIAGHLLSEGKKSQRRIDSYLRHQAEQKELLTRMMARIQKKKQRRAVLDRKINEEVARFNKIRLRKL